MCKMGDHVDVGGIGDKIFLAKNSSDVSLLTTLAQGEKEVRIALTYNGNLPYEIQKVLLDDEDEDVSFSMGINSDNSEISREFNSRQNKAWKEQLMYRKRVQDLEEIRKAREHQNYLRMKEHYLDVTNTTVEGLYMVMDRAIAYEDNDTLVEIVNNLICTWDVANDMLGKVKGEEVFAPTVDHIVSSRFFNGQMLLSNVEPFSESLKASLNRFFDMKKLTKHMFHQELKKYIEN